MKVKSLSRVRPLVTPWTAAHQLLRPWDFPGKSTGMGFCWYSNLLMNVMNTYTDICEYIYVCVCVYVYERVSNGTDLTSSLEAVCWDVESQGFCISWVQMLAQLLNKTANNSFQACLCSRSSQSITCQVILERLV